MRDRSRNSTADTWRDSPSRGYDRDVYGYALPAIDTREALMPLLERLKRYDARRRTLEREGGSLSDLKKITTLLTSPVTLEGRYESREVSLTNQAGLWQGLRGIDYDLHVDIRKLRSTLPVYYICRTRSDYWSEYSLIVEDLYMGSGYPLTDERFIKLMREGHEVYFLRLSQFRKAVAERVDGPNDRQPQEVDALLYDLGRHVFQAAWHEDQRLGMLVAKHLSLPRFHQAIELLYLCLSGELCELRATVNTSMLRFFETVYPQAAIQALLERLTRADGATLNDLHRQAKRRYKQLHAALSQFVGTEVAWGAGRLRVPLWQLLYGNFNRLHLVAKGLHGDRRLAKAAAELEKVAQTLVDELISVSEAVNRRGGSQPAVTDGGAQ